MLVLLPDVGDLHEQVRQPLQVLRLLAHLVHRERALHRVPFRQDVHRALLLLVLQDVRHRRESSHLPFLLPALDVATFQATHVALEGGHCLLPELQVLLHEVVHLVLRRLGLLLLLGELVPRLHRAVLALLEGFGPLLALHLVARDLADHVLDVLHLLLERLQLLLPQLQVRERYFEAVHGAALLEGLEGGRSYLDEASLGLDALLDLGELVLDFLDVVLVLRRA